MTKYKRILIRQKDKTIQFHLFSLIAMQASTSRWRTRPGAQLPGRRWRERTSLPTLGWTSSPSTWWSSSPPSKYLVLRHRDNWSSLSWQACQPESAFFCEGKYCKQDDSLSWNYIHGVEGDRTTLQIYFGKNIRAHSWEVTPPPPPPPSPVFGHPAWNFLQDVITSPISSLRWLNQWWIVSDLSIKSAVCHTF